MGSAAEAPPYAGSCGPEARNLHSGPGFLFCPGRAGFPPGTVTVNQGAMDAHNRCPTQDRVQGTAGVYAHRPTHMCTHVCVHTRTQAPHVCTDLHTREHTCTHTNTPVCTQPVYMRAHSHGPTRTHMFTDTLACVCNWPCACSRKHTSTRVHTCTGHTHTMGIGLSQQRSLHAGPSSPPGDGPGSGCTAQSGPVKASVVNPDCGHTAPTRASGATQSRAGGSRRRAGARAAGSHGTHSQPRKEGLSCCVPMEGSGPACPPQGSPTASPIPGSFPTGPDCSVCVLERDTPEHTRTHTSQATQPVTPICAPWKPGPSTKPPSICDQWSHFHFPRPRDLGPPETVLRTQAPTYPSRIQGRSLRSPEARVRG